MIDEHKELDADATSYIGKLETENLGYVKVIESLTRIIEGMEKDFEKLETALLTIRRNTFSTNPQAMVMKDIANNALYKKE